MIGSRPLTTEEVARVSDKLGARDRMMFVLGLKTGFRVQELLSLQVSDVIRDDGEIVDVVSVSRQNMKGKVSGRTVALHRDAKLAIDKWRRSCPLDSVPDAPLFAGPSGVAISRVQAWRVLTAAYRAAGVFGKLGTHAMRKTFANRVYNKLGKDLPRTQKALGHVTMSSTVSYIAFADAEVDKAVLEA